MAKQHIYRQHATARADCRLLLKAHANTSERSTQIGLKREKMSKLTDMTDAEILAIAEPMMDNLLDGSNEVDHAKHVRDFTQRLKDIVTKANLEAQCANRSLGYFSKREFVCVFRKQHNVGVVWRQFFSKSDDEYVNHAIFVQRGDQILIDHCLIC